MLVSTTCPACNQPFSWEKYPSTFRDRIYCSRSCARRLNSKKHKQSSSGIYTMWQNMKQRCLNPNNKDYPDYGGKGVTVCEEWLEFEPFYFWAINHGWKQGFQNHRLDERFGYSMSNCILLSASDHSKISGSKPKKKRAA